MTSLQNWSWQQIYETYQFYGGALLEYEGLRKRCSIPRTISIDYPERWNLFIMQFNEEVRKIDRKLSLLDAEISRRRSKRVWLG